MATQMTRAEYERLYGVKPVFSGTSVLDDEKPAPVRMTRAEYEAMYYPKQPKRELVKETAGDVTETVLGVGKSVGDIYSKSMDIVEDKDYTLPQKTMGVMGKIAGGVSGAIGELVIGAGKALLSQKQEDKLKSIVGGAAQGVAETDTAKSVIDWYGGLDKNDKLFVDSVGGVASLMADVYAPGVAKTAAKPVVTGVKDVAKTVEDVIPKVTQKLDRRSVDNVVNELTKIEEKYAKSRTADSYMKPDDVAASRARIAESNVLDGAVDSNGVIRTTNAVDNYRRQTIDGMEDTVRKALIESKEAIPVTMVRQVLVREVGRSGLEGADLVSALKKIDKEMEGLNTRIKGSSIVDLRYLHDNKVATTRNINYLTPPEKATYRKAIARGYKMLVEENSKKVEVKKINDELKQYYGDIERLERLDGARAEGGRLGKYTASIAGTLIGGAAGSIGGGFGAAVGGIIGGEAAAVLKGAGMARTFKGGGKGLPKSAVLEKARLSIPDKVIKAKAGVPKTKEITKIEKDIAKNVADQKKAIKAGDFTLVAALKEVYTVLVEELKKAIKYLNENGSVGMSIKKSISPEQKRMVAKALESYDESPVTMASRSSAVEGGMNKTLDLGSDANAQLSLLKDRNALGKFTDADALEAQRLLQEVGALDKTAGLTGDAKLMAEAKGKTLEEFVKKQQIVYHGSQTPLTKFSNKQGTFFTDDYMNAEGYASGENVYEGYLNFKNPLVIDAKGAFHRELNTKWGKTTREVVANVDSNKYDGIIFKNIKDSWIDDAEVDTPSTIYYAFKPRESFLNESQLTDIWKKANKADTSGGFSDLATEAKKYKSAEVDIKKRVSDIFRLQGQELDDITIIGSTARGKANPNDLDILITRKKPFEDLSSDKLKDRKDLIRVFETELKDLFPDKKIQVVLSRYDEKQGPQMSLSEYLAKINQE